MDEKILKKVFEECRIYFGASEDGIKIKKEFGDGKSGNKVFLIEILDSKNTMKNGHYVMKIASHSGEQFLKEIFNTMELGNIQGDFNGLLFPRYEHAGEVEGTLYYVYDVAGSELNSTIDLSGEMTSGESILEKISRELLLGWNKDFENKQFSIAECISGLVGRERLDVSGRIASRISQLIGDALSPNFSYESKVFPNPYYYLNNLHSPLAKQINGIVGKVHGDLNSNNIIVNKNFINDNYDIYIIDYSHYINHGYLFFDHAYLQMNLLLSSQSATNIFEWCADVSNIVEEFGKFNKKYLFVKYIYDGILTFINKYQSNNKENSWIQYYSAQIAVGLNWMNKSGSDEIRQALCFLYASIWLKKLLEILKVELIDKSDAELTLLGGDKEREIWNKLDHFNSLDNRYILLSSCSTKEIEKEKFASFLGVKWEAIFHMTNTAEDEICKDFFPKLKARYGVQYKFLPEEDKSLDYEMVPTWCTIQLPVSGNLKVWYKRYVQTQINKLLKSILGIRENEKVYIVADVKEDNFRIIEELITDIQLNAGNSQICVISLNNYNMNLETDEYLEEECLEYVLQDIASCAAIIMNNERGSRSVWMPKKEIGQNKSARVYLEDEEVNYISMDFTIVCHSLGWSEEKGDAGEAFYRGAEPSWRDIAERRDIEREDYKSEWKRDIENRLKNLGSSVVTSISLFHRAGAGGTTLSRRILWDFHTQYPCLLMKKLEKGTGERLKFVYDKTKLPVLIIVEISAGNITQVDINNLRIELINKGIRALFICVSRVNNINIKQYPSNFYLPSGLEMVMSETECDDMYDAYMKMTSEEKVQNNLYKLSYGEENEWKELRQPFFYGLFTFDKEYTSIPEFIEKSMINTNSAVKKVIVILAFMTQYSQIGLRKIDIEKLLKDEESTGDEVEILLNNPLIVHKGTGYQICHPVIADHILEDKFEKDGKKENDGKEEKDKIKQAGCLKYVKNFIDTLMEIYTPDSVRLNDILEEIFTHREYYIDEEKYKFSNLIMQFDDNNKKEIFKYLTKKFPDNPHFYNHLARVYIYPSGKVTIDFETAIDIAAEAIEKSELAENEGVGIHHHLMGKIYTKQCKSMISNAKRYSKVVDIWEKVKPIYEVAEIEFSKCMTGNNAAYGLIGKMELLSGILNRFHKTKKLSINSILEREPYCKKEFMELIGKMYTILTEYTMKFGTENKAYRNSLKNFYESLGNIKMLQKQLSLKGLTLKERLSTRRALAALEIWKNSSTKTNFFELPEESLEKIFDLINENIKEEDANYHDRLMWFRCYMRMKDFNVRKAYEFLMEWPEGDKSHYVCFYRYVLGFMMYYNNDLDFSLVEKHLKQSNTLAHNLYGISITSTRELVGINEEEIYLIPDNLEAELGKFTNEEREEYRSNYCYFFEGQISDFSKSMFSIRFSLDNVHSFTAKIPAVDNINGMNVGDNVRFALGFSYSEMRAWNVQKITE